MSKVTLWVPATEAPRWPCLMSWWNLETPDRERPQLLPGRPIANNIRYSWNKVVQDFLETDSEWLFSVHSDVVFQPQTLMRLLSWDKPLVSALIFMRQSPVVPHIWKSYDNSNGRYANRITDTREWFYAHKEWIRFGSFVMDPRPDDALVEIDFTSTSCTLMHRTVLEALREPMKEQWFVWDDDHNGGGEDRNFFQHARAAGFPAYVDRSCVVGHLVGDVPTSSADFIAWDSVSDFHNTGEPEELEDEKIAERLEYFAGKSE